LKISLSKNVNTFYITLLLLVVLTACGTKQATLSNTNTIKSTPKLLFLNYNLKKNKNGTKSIQFINKIITDGTLKNHKIIKNGTIGDLQCSQLNKKNKIIKSKIIKNPLKKTIEYLDDSKSFHIKEVNLDSTQISLKLKLEHDTKYIIISEISNSKKTIPLIKTKIH